MKNFLEFLWHEEYRPAEKAIVNHDKIDKLERILDDKEQLFISGLSKEQNEMYEDIMDIHCKLLDLRQLDAFTKGAHLIGTIFLDIVNHD